MFDSGGHLLLDVVGCCVECGEVRLRVGTDR